MLTTLAKVFGAVFIIVGILGFIPPVAPNEMLLGIFHVNAAHNLVHILSGVAALALSSSVQGSRLFFRVFGIVYGLVAILGFMIPHGHILGLISNNPADTWLHVAIASASIFLGFFYKEPSRVTM